MHKKVLYGALLVIGIPTFFSAAEKSHQIQTEAKQKVEKSERKAALASLIKLAQRDGERYIALNKQCMQDIGLYSSLIIADGDLYERYSEGERESLTRKGIILLDWWKLPHEGAYVGARFEDLVIMNPVARKNVSG